MSFRLQFREKDEVLVFGKGKGGYGNITLKQEALRPVKIFKSLENEILKNRIIDIDFEK